MPYMTETREAMLEAGVRLYSTLAADLLRGMSAGAVAKEAGFHRQTFYRYWDTQSEYVRDLIRHVLAPPDRPVADGAAVVAEYHDGVDMASFIHDMARVDFVQAIEDRSAAMRVSLLMMEALGGGEPAEQTAAYYERTMVLAAQSYEVLLQRWSLELVPPSTTRDLARMVMALVLGLVVQAKSCEDDPHASVVLERAVATLLEGLTRPMTTASVS